MPTDYEIDLERHLVVSFAHGVLTEAESEDLYARLRRDPAFEPGLHQICDLSGVSDLHASKDFIQRLALTSPFDPSSRRAFVAPSDLHYGLARMLEAYIELEGGDAGVFRSRSEAESWLGEQRDVLP